MEHLQLPLPPSERLIVAAISIEGLGIRLNVNGVVVYESRISYFGVGQNLVEIGKVLKRISEEKGFK